MTLLHTTRIRFDALPGDVFALLLGFLGKRDLLALSHVSRPLFCDLLGPHSVTWQSRLPAPPFAGNVKWTALVHAKNKPKGLKARSKNAVAALRRALASTGAAPRASLKEAYFTSLSLRFLGRPWDRIHFPMIPHDIRIPDRVCSSWATTESESFSFDVWFVVSTEQRFSRFGPFDVVGGGVLLSSTNVPRKPSRGHDFVSIAQGNLICSLVDHQALDQPVVAQGLLPHRWYHLALSFDRSSADSGGRGTQRVFLDANFDGVVDEFRLWTGVLSADDVVAMQRGGESPLTGEATCCWSLKRDGEINVDDGMITFVRCPRPHEDRQYRAEKDVLWDWRHKRFPPVYPRS